MMNPEEEPLPRTLKILKTLFELVQGTETEELTDSLVTPLMTNDIPSLPTYRPKSKGFPPMNLNSICTFVREVLKSIETSTALSQYDAYNF